MQAHCSPWLSILLACLVTLSTSRHLQDPPSQLGVWHGAGPGHLLLRAM